MRVRTDVVKYFKDEECENLEKYASESREGNQREKEAVEGRRADVDRE